MESRRGFLKLLGLGGAGAAASMVPTVAQPEPTRQLVFVGKISGEMVKFEVDPPPSVFINRKRYYSYHLEHFTKGMLTSVKPLYLGLGGKWEEFWKNEVVYDIRNEEVLIPISDPFWATISQSLDASEEERKAAKKMVRRWHHIRAAATGFPYLGPEKNNLAYALFTNPNLEKLARRWQEKQAKAEGEEEEE